MNLCEACQTCAHCLKSRCIPITREPDTKKPGTFRRWLAYYCALVKAGTTPLRMNYQEPPFRPMVLCGHVEQPLTFPDIDPSMIPTKGQP